MGTFGVAVRLGDPATRQFAEVEALVDTRASDTMMPQSLLARLGIDVVDRHTYRLADETLVEYDVGEARLRLDDREMTVKVIFGPDGSTPLLGATALEIFHLGVDPVGQRLIRVPGLLK